MKNFEIFYLFLKRNRENSRDSGGPYSKIFAKKFVFKIAVREKIENLKKSFF